MRKPSFKPNLALLPLALVLHACGGGGGPTASGNPVPKNVGRVRVTVAWPEAATKAIPTNANSIRVEVANADGALANQLLARPATTANFTELPVGQATIRATAYASADGTGVPLAVAEIPTAIGEDIQPVSLTLATTVDHLVATPASVTLAPGGSRTVTLTALDAQSRVVLLDPGALSFASSAPGIASVTGAGLVSAVAAGSATITGTDANSGKSVAVATSITNDPIVDVTPDTARITLRKTQSFAASVTSSSDTRVTWSVQESNGGTITAAGVYTAPSAKGTYHVIATSVADPSRKDVATVTVTSGGAAVTIQ